MINRVNKAPVLRLVTSQAKRSENDPGNSQGGALAYEGPPSHKESEEVAPTQPPSEAPSPALSLDPHPESKSKEGKTLIKSLNAVYEEFFKKKIKPAPAGLTTQYSDDHSSAKGMLLNKKAE